VRTTPGELLWPSLFDEAKVAKLELNLGPYGAAGQLQQRPAPEGGGLFQRSSFKFVDALPKKVVRRVRGWDTAGTEADGDNTRGVRMSELDGVFFIEDGVGGQLGPADVEALMRQTAQHDGHSCGVREEREGGASGKAVEASHTKLLAGYDYKCVTIGADKVTRAKPFRAQVQAGNVFIVRGNWDYEGYIRELCEFPAGKKDDWVDASSCAFNSLLEEPKYVPTECVW
jgi:predicted phage terminase large subunit-like protein